MSSPFNTAGITPGSYRPDQIILQFEDGSNDALHSQALAAIGGRLNAVIARGDGTIPGQDAGEVHQVTLGQGVTVEKAIAILSHLPGVKFAEPDFVATSAAVSNDVSVVSMPKASTVATSNLQPPIFEPVKAIDVPL